MWNTGERTQGKKLALAGGGYVPSAGKKNQKGKLSCVMAMVLGGILTLEIMIGGAMLLNIDFYGADVIAVALVFVVIYFGVVAVLTDR